MKGGIATENNNGNMPVNGCAADKPYPPVTVSGKDPAFAALLSEDYGGRAGELTAITQYFYQEIITEETDASLSKALECISMVEMTHMEMLGKLLLLLGGDPMIGTYGRRGFNPWSGSYPSYRQDIRRILRENIAAEEEAIRNYKTRIGQTNDENIRALLRRIILDEEEHIHIFRHFLGGAE